RARRGCAAGDVHGHLAGSEDLQAGTRESCALAVRGRAKQHLRPRPRPARATGGGAGRTGARGRPGRAGRAELALLACPRGTRNASRPRARADRAGVLGRPLAERNRLSCRDPTRYRENTHAERAFPLGGRAGRGVEVTNEPDFRELVGDEGGREELDRLRRVHELLVAAGPPAELSPRVANPPQVEESKVLEFKRRRPATLLA